MRKSRIKKNIKLQEKPKEKPKYMVMTVVIAIIMIFSVLAVMLWNDNTIQQETYKEYKFYPTKENVWLLKKDGIQLFFNYLPQTVENISIDPNIIESIKQAKVIYVTFDENGTSREYAALASYLIKTNLENSKKAIVALGLTKENEYNISVIDCKNATDYIPVIKYEESEERAVTKEKNCIHIFGKTYDFLQQTDRLLYEVLGII